MANRRVEKRTVAVTTEEDVLLMDCDTCGKTAELPKTGFEGYGAPAGWLTVASGAKVDGMFCSRECVRQWASASTKLIEIARAAFAKQTTG